MILSGGKIMKIDREEAEKILEAVDVVCMNCIEDTLNKNVCDNCPVRKMCNELEWKEE